LRIKHAPRTVCGFQSCKARTCRGGSNRIAGIRALGIVLARPIWNKEHSAEETGCQYKPGVSDMHTSGPVLIMQLPEKLKRAEAEAFCLELQPLLQSDRPRLVLDCS